jgi:hypothetical protein
MMILREKHLRSAPCQRDRSTVHCRVPLAGRRPVAAGRAGNGRRTAPIQRDSGATAWLRADGGQAIPRARQRRVSRVPRIRTRQRLSTPHPPNTPCSRPRWRGRPPGRESPRSVPCRRASRSRHLPAGRLTGDVGLVVHASYPLAEYGEGGIIEDKGVRKEERE